MFDSHIGVAEAPEIDDGRPVPTGDPFDRQGDLLEASRRQPLGADKGCTYWAFDHGKRARVAKFYPGKTYYQRDITLSIIPG